jgi:hypothetical protein
MTRAPRATVVVAGYIVRYPLAGSLLASLQYVLGFERLGCRAYFLDDMPERRRCDLRACRARRGHARPRAR